MEFAIKGYIQFIQNYQLLGEKGIFMRCVLTHSVCLLSVYIIFYSKTFEHIPINIPVTVT